MYTGAMDIDIDPSPPPATTWVGRRWTRLLDGDRRWGSTDTWYARHGMTRRRLVIFPPGISDTERRRLRVWRGWPLWGSALWLVLEVVLSNRIAPVHAVTVTTGLFVVSGVVAFICAGDPRREVRTQIVVTMEGLLDLETMVHRAEITRRTATLVDADRRLASGQISAVEHEATWNDVYQQLSADAARRSHTR